MKWLIIVFVVMSLIGSVMWVMPTPRQRFQAQLRLRARKLGFQVQLVKLQLPRQRGEVEAETLDIPAYRMLRSNLSREERDGWRNWQMFRGETLANTGLAPGWSWIRGERTLSETALSQVNRLLEQLPSDVVALESSPVHVTAFWQEGEDADLERIAELLKSMIDARV